MVEAGESEFFFPSSSEDNSFEFSRPSVIKIPYQPSSSSYLCIEDLLNAVRSKENITRLSRMIFFDVILLIPKVER